jgi:hypothetical protein
MKMQGCEVEAIGIKTDHRQLLDQVELENHHYLRTKQVNTAHNFTT